MRKIANYFKVLRCFWKARYCHYEIKLGFGVAKFAMPRCHEYDRCCNTIWFCRKSVRSGLSTINRADTWVICVQERKEVKYEWLCFRSSRREIGWSCFPTKTRSSSLCFIVAITDRGWGLHQQEDVDNFCQPPTASQLHWGTTYPVMLSHLQTLPLVVVKPKHFKVSRIAGKCKKLLMLVSTIPPFKK